MRRRAATEIRGTNKRSSMNVTEAFENMLNIWTEQMNKCAAAEKG